MLILAGTLPIEGLEVVEAEARLINNQIAIANYTFPINRGTASLIASSCMVCEQYGLDRPWCMVSGDIGRGDGSAKLYRHLQRAVPAMKPAVAAFHYIMPDWHHHDEVFKEIQKMENKPILIADAGFMYVAKMSGFAPGYDVFTPDLGELAFLADDEAPHPFYTRGFIFHMEDKVEKLIEMAYNTGGAAKYLLVKGKKDYIYKNNSILYQVEEPDISELEAIGGTGDTITGIAAALIYKGMPIAEALKIAAMANRIAGEFANPTPATQIEEIIGMIPAALDEVMN